MPNTKPPRFNPEELAELLERTRLDVKRYRLLHPEWRQPLDEAAPVTPGQPEQPHAKA
jgi:hypothetical protein